MRPFRTRNKSYKRAEDRNTQSRRFAIFDILDLHTITAGPIGRIIHSVLGPVLRCMFSSEFKGDLHAPIRVNTCTRNWSPAITVRSASSHLRKSADTATTKGQAQLLGFWHLREPSRSNPEAPGELFRCTARRDRTMRGWNV